MQRGEEPKARRTRIRLARWALAVVGLALNLALSFGTDLYSNRARVGMLAGPALPDPTVQRFSVDYRWPDGSTQTVETYQAFKGHFQVVELALSPGDVDQVLAVELVRKMLARVG